MCGIVGIADSSGLSSADDTFLNNATQLMFHRGPDGQGVWIENKVGFGHRRLSIIDLAGGTQPMHDATGRYTITFNGEIYNYKDLRRFLKSKEYVFQTASDTEVILNAYAHWGTACVEHLNGIFAFGLWDADKHTLFLARDHLGVKPLLYYIDGERLIFSSELKAILRHPAMRIEIDLPALSDYLSLGYVLAPKTIIRNIRKLSPATWLIWENGCIRLKRYWDLASIANQAPRQFISEKKAVEELQGELERAVRMQLVSDVPLGAFLSGGIDSSTVVQKMVSSFSGRVQTFSIGFKEKSYSELPYARLAADYLGTQHFEQDISPDLETLLPQLAWYFDEPFSDTSAVPTYALCQLARQHVTVALSGDGGDECFAGYETYLADKIQSVYRRVPYLVHRFLIVPFITWLPSTHHKVSWDYKMKQFVSYARSMPEQSHYSWRLLFSEVEKKMLWGDDIQRQLGGYTPFEIFLDYYHEVSNASALNRSLYVDAKTWLADAMLVKVDRASMANGLEVRVPLLDYKLVEFAMFLPAHFKLHGFQTKFLLKRAMEPFLPKAIVYRSKRGFNSPVAQWVERFSEAMAGGHCSLIAGQSRMWKQLMRDHYAHLADNGFKLWTLLNWTLWTRSVLA